jgi:tripeptide aminopeptidase
MSASDIQTTYLIKQETLAFMPKKVRSLFMNILNVQSNSFYEEEMVNFICHYLGVKGISYEMDKIGNILVQKGNANVFPCLVAHLDTVHPIIPDYEVYTKIEHNREIAWSPTGIGGDDKCGILACLWMLDHVKNIKLVFFTSEETCQKGSCKIDHKWFDNCGYIIQLDRWGRGDFISMYYDQQTVSNEYFEKAKPLMSLFGYKETEGLITDSINLWYNKIGISCVNVSCGYYQHHTRKEKIDLNETWNALIFTRELIFTLGEEKYPSVPKFKFIYKNKYLGYGGWWNNYKKAQLLDDDEWWDDYKKSHNIDY